MPGTASVPKARLGVYEMTAANVLDVLQFMALRQATTVDDACLPSNAHASGRAPQHAEPPMAPLGTCGSCPPGPLRGLRHYPPTAGPDQHRSRKERNQP